jgi:hypothetical protein
MTTVAPADWYPDPERPGVLRYWDGTAWTHHQAPGQLPPAMPLQPKIRPGLVAVWITAALSLFTFYIRSVGSDGHVTTISIPMIGIIFMIVCWSLVSRGQRDARRLGIELPGPYRAARITAGVLAALSVVARSPRLLGPESQTH